MPPSKEEAIKLLERMRQPRVSNRLDAADYDALFLFIKACIGRLPRAATYRRALQRQCALQRQQEAVS